MQADARKPVSEMTMEELQKIDPDVGMSGVDLEQLHNWGVVEPSVPIKVKDKMPGKKNPSLAHDRHKQQVVEAAAEV